MNMSLLSLIRFRTSSRIRAAAGERGGGGGGGRRFENHNNSRNHDSHSDLGSRQFVSPQPNAKAETKLGPVSSRESRARVDEFDVVREALRSDQRVGDRFMAPAEWGWLTSQSRSCSGRLGQRQGDSPEVKGDEGGGRLSADSQLLSGDLVLVAEPVGSVAAAHCVVRVPVRYRFRVSLSHSQVHPLFSVSSTCTSKIATSTSKCC